MLQNPIPPISGKAIGIETGIETDGPLFSTALVVSGRGRKGGAKSLGIRLANHTGFRGAVRRNSSLNSKHHKKSDASGERGYEAGKDIWGYKWHVIVDTSSRVVSSTGYRQESLDAVLDIAERGED